MVPAPKIEHARHEAPSNLFWAFGTCGLQALCWPSLPPLSWFCWSLPLPPFVLPLAHLLPSSLTAIFSPEVNLVFIVLVSRRTSSSGANGYRDVLITRLPIAGLSFPLIIPILTTRGPVFCFAYIRCLPPLHILTLRPVHDKSNYGTQSILQWIHHITLSTNIFSLHLVFVIKCREKYTFARFVFLYSVDIEFSMKPCIRRSHFMVTIWTGVSLHHAVAILDEINCEARVVCTFFYERNITWQCMN